MAPLAASAFPGLFVKVNVNVVVEPAATVAGEIPSVYWSTSVPPPGSCAADALVTGARQASEATTAHTNAHEQIDVNAPQSAPDARVDLICVPLFRV